MLSMSSIVGSTSHNIINNLINIFNKFKLKETLKQENKTFKLPQLCQMLNLV